MSLFGKILGPPSPLATAELAMDWTLGYHCCTPGSTFHLRISGLFGQVVPSLSVPTNTASHLWQAANCLMEKSYDSLIGCVRLLLWCLQHCKELGMLPVACLHHLAVFSCRLPCHLFPCALHGRYLPFFLLYSNVWQWRQKRVDPNDVSQVCVSSNNQVEGLGCCVSAACYPHYETNHNSFMLYEKNRLGTESSSWLISFPIKVILGLLAAPVFPFQWTSMRAVCSFTMLDVISLAAVWSY